MKKNPWWKTGTVYQIYPRSFFDSNKDGVGDIRGIIEKLDYLHWLGIDAVWISPVNTSPMYDFGYDISNYRDIDPVYGNLKDFDRFISESHKLGIKIIMDLVINHSSHLHQWFAESRSSRVNPKRDWYIWRDGNGEKPPNNWKSAFGGSAWEWDDTTGQYYLHSFLKEQPDFNWRNVELKNAVFEDVRFWLDRGVDGFRLDVVNWYVKDKKFRNNPFTVKPLDPEKHKYDRNRPETHDIIKELRTLVDSYDDRVCVGEVFSLMPGNPELSASFLGNGEDELHLAFDFSIMYRLWSARQFYRSLKRWYKAIPEKGWPCNVLSNHDQPRGRSRYMGKEACDARARVAAVFLLTLRGTPFLYYGEEIGMSNTKLARSEIVDPLGKKFWPIYKGRDVSRTPMQWDQSDYAGFSTVRPWLPVNSDYEKVNAAAQMKDRYSILNLYRKLISLRKKNKALTLGEWIPVVKGKNNVFAYFRIYNDETIFVALNFSSAPRKIKAGNRGQWRVILSTHRTKFEHFTELNFILLPNEATIIKKIGEL